MSVGEGLSNHEVFETNVDPEFSRVLDEAAQYVTNNIDLVINGQLIEHPFKGTYTMAAVVVGAEAAEKSGEELLAAGSAKSKSEHLEETMGYGDLSPIAFRKAKQLVEIAESLPADKLRTSNPETVGALVESGDDHLFMGGSRIDSNEPGSQKFIIGTSGGEGTAELIRALFPDETFDFENNPTELERGAGLLDELVSRLAGGLMIFKAMGRPIPERMTLELSQLQQGNIAAIEEAVAEVPGNKKPDGSQSVSID